MSSYEIMKEIGRLEWSRNPMSPVIERIESEVLYETSYTVFMTLNQGKQWDLDRTDYHQSVVNILRKVKTRLVNKTHRLYNRVQIQCVYVIERRNKFGKQVPRHVHALASISGIENLAAFPIAMWEVLGMDFLPPDDKRTRSRKHTVGKYLTFQEQIIATNWILDWKMHLPVLEGRKMKVGEYESVYAKLNTDMQVIAKNDYENFQKTYDYMIKALKRDAYERQQYRGATLVEESTIHSITV